MFMEYEKHVISYIALYCSNKCLAGQGFPYVPMVELTGNNQQRAYTKAGLASKETLSSSCNPCKMLESLCWFKSRILTGVPLPFLNHSRHRVRRSSDLAKNWNRCFIH
jgi:hypothetical protein